MLGNFKTWERAPIEGILRGKAGKVVFGRISDGGVDGLERTAYQIALLFSFLTGRPPPRLPSQPPDLPGKGRRTGSVARWIFQEFVWHLLLSTSEVGGEFTFAKEPLTGTLIGAIEMLAPYLPDGFVPKPLPGSTLQRLIELMY